MTLADLRTYLRFLTNTNSTTYTDTDTLVSLNAHYDYFVNEILESMDDWEFQAEVATCNLVASQQEYTLPTDIIKLKRVEVTYDGTNWYVANHFDINERSEPTDSTSVNADFSTSKPYFDLMDTGLFLYPIPTANVTAGLKIWYEKNATALSAVGDSPVFMKAFHKGLAYGAAKDYFEKFLDNKANQAKLIQAEKNYYSTLERMKQSYQRRNQDRPYVVLPAYGEYDYGNE